MDLWEENVLALTVFQAMNTQWNHGFNGPIGMNYTALPVVFELLNIEEDARPDTFTKLQIAESAALDVIRKQQKKPTK